VRREDSSHIRTAIGALSLVFALAANAQLIIYPADGQSPQK
jgi:hypothetical protein